MIDAHTHFYPNFISENPEIWAEKHNEQYWKLLIGKRSDGKLSLQGFPSIEKFLSDMQDAGIGKAIIQGWYWQYPKTCEIVNNAISQIINNHKDNLTAFAAIQPAYLQESLDIIKSARKLGFCGIGELHDGVQQFSYDSSNFHKILEACQSEDFPINIHLTEKTQRQYLGKVDTNFEQAYAIAKKFPKVKFIYAHWCGNELFKQSQDVIDLFKLENTFFDSAASPLTSDISAWATATNLNKDKAIFGSDYPLRLYPRKFRIEELKTIVDEATKNMPLENQECFFKSNITNIIKAENFA